MALRFVLLKTEDRNQQDEESSRASLKRWLDSQITRNGGPGFFFASEMRCLYEALKDRGPWTLERLEYARQELEAFPVGGSEEVARQREEAIISRTRACEQSEWLRNPLDEFTSTIPHEESSHRFLFVALAFVLLLTAPVGSSDAVSEAHLARSA